MKIVHHITTVAVCASMIFSIACENKIVVTPDVTSSSSSEEASLPRLKVYVENSGSMDGYMCDGSQLKDAVFDYVSDLSQSTSPPHLYYINSDTLPYRGSLASYIKTMNPAGFCAVGGNRAHSDMSDMLRMIIGGLSENDVALFISDCILDLPGVNAKDFLTNCQINIKNTFINGRKHHPRLAVEIIKMESDFTGRYFSQNGVETLQGVKRPYYIWVMGNEEHLAMLNKNAPIADLRKYGLKGTVAFTGLQQIPFDIKNRSLTSGVVNPTKGQYLVTIRADFKKTLQQDNVILDKRNILLSHPGVKIEGIYPITDANSAFTHFIQLSLPKDINTSTTTVTLCAPPLAAWVKETNDTMGVDIKKHLNQTTGILQLVQGVSDAYKKENTIANIRFTVKRR